MINENILVIGPYWVGDMIMSQVIYRQIKISNPKAKITVLAPPWSIPIALRIQAVDVIIEVPFKPGYFDLYKRYKIGKALRKRKFTQAIVIPGSWKSALVPFFANIPIRTGYLGEFRFGLLNDIRKFTGISQRIVDHYVYLSIDYKSALPIINDLPKLQIVPKNLNTLQHKFNIVDNNKKTLALCAGAAFGPSKQWPAEYCSDLINLIQQDWNIWLFGSQNDQAFINSIVQNITTKVINFAGQLALPDTIDLLSSVDAIIANDSGLMHMGSSLNIPLIAIYGSTPAVKAPPISKNCIMLEQPQPCKPCYKRVCPLQHFKCMRDIIPTMVQEKLKQILNY